MKNEIQRNPELLNIKDELQRSLLYLSARCGYYDITDYLIKKGIDLNITQKDNSSPLHGASYYGQKMIVELLIDHGAKISLKNAFGHLASDEARTKEIEKIILESENDKITKLFRILNDNKLVDKMVFVKKKNKIIAKKLLCNGHLNKNIKDWIPVWHGTKFRFLESIAKHGLQPSGTTLKDGTIINPLPGHISLDATIDGINNWAKAIFVSPSIFYASHNVYAERILSSKKNWTVLIEARIRPNSYSSHSSTVLNYVPKCGEAVDVEYRVDCDEDDELIYRSPSGNNIALHAIVFVLVKFLDNIEDFVEGNIVVNSKEERELLNV